MWSDYFLYLLETVTFVVAFIILLVAIVAIVTKDKDLSSHKISIKKLNDKFHDLAESMHEQVNSKQERKAHKKQEKKSGKANKDAPSKPTLFVLRFAGDIQAKCAKSLAEEVSAILMVANKERDEVLLILESPGGAVSGYGLAASQLQRIRDKGIKLTVAVDKVAASGGYLMACVANTILAAPFAIIGSIGVVAQIPNFNRLLKKNHVDFEMITAGEYKRTLTLFGENDDKARDKMKQDLEQIHLSFQDFIRENRAQVNLDEVATGEYWLATKAKELQLVDEIITSDEYLLSQYKEKQLIEVASKHKKPLGKKLFSQAEEALLNVFDKAVGRWGQPF